jgi:predicted Fe-Mo cluster-binding NifX family protein
MKMKIAITSTNNSLDALVSEQFGRCQYFLIVDSETMKFKDLPNPGIVMQSGAGPKAAELIFNNGAEVLLTGHIGDKAEEALKRCEIKIVDGLKGTTKVKEAINNYLSKLKQGDPK